MTTRTEIGVALIGLAGIIIGAVLTALTQRRGQDDARAGELRDDLIRRIEQLDARVVTLEAERDRDQLRISELQAELLSARERVSKLEARIVELERENADLAARAQCAIDGCPARKSAVVNAVNGAKA